MRPKYCGFITLQLTLVMAGEVRQNFHSDCEKAINSQIALELEAMYKYLSMASYFERHNVALPGFAQYFHKAAHEELQHVEMLAKYQSKRGGQVTFQDIKKPAKDEWGTGQIRAHLSYLHLCKRDPE